MKTTVSHRFGKTGLRLSRLLPIGTCLLMAAVAPVQGQIIADFVDGGSHASQINNKVDAYRGMVGDGWTSRWVLRNDYGSGGSYGSVAVVSDGALWTGNRLKLTPNGNATGTGFGVSRQYTSHGAVNISQPLMISFQVSFDDLGAFLNTSSNQIFIGENNTDAISATTTTTWFVQAFGGPDPAQNLTKVGYETAKQGQWNLGDGSGFVPTGLLLEENVLYSFTLALDPANHTYTVRMTNGTQVFQSGILHFRSEQVLGRTLVFGQQYVATEGATFSFGHIAIVPEPSAIGLASIGLVLGAFQLYRHRRTLILPF